MAEQLRKHENPFNKMNDNSVMLTNFPARFGLSTSKVEELIKQADKNAVIKSIQIQQAMRGEMAQSSGQIAAYAIVEFLNGHDVVSVRRALRKHWIDDCLLRVKTMQDYKQETFNERTIVVSGIVAHAGVVDLVDSFG